MKYQLAYYAPGPDSWRFVRDDQHEICHFDSLGQAESRAAELSKQLTQIGHSVVVMTIHLSVKTDVAYPKPAPIYTTKVVDAFGEERT